MEGQEKLPVSDELSKHNVSSEGDALEAVLSHVGEWGTYQKWLVAATMPFGLFFAFVYFVQMFITVTPQRHWCWVPELEHLQPDLRRNLSVPGAAEGEAWDRCRVYVANWTQVLEDGVPPDPDTPTVTCKDGWEFELTDIPYQTVSSERGWVCERAGYAPFAQALFFVGSILGGALFGWLADTHGRVPALVGSNLLACIGGIATVFTTGLWDFAFCRFLVGMAYDNCFIMMYILVLEYVGPRYRTWVANMSIGLYFGTGCLMLPWIAVWVANWRRLVLYTSVPMVITIVIPWTVPESARWLVSKGRMSKALEVLRKLEKINKTKIPKDVLEDFVASSNQVRSEYSVMTLFKSNSLRMMMLYLVTVYMACALIFDGLVRLSDALGLDFFLTFTLASATEIPSITLLALVLDKWGRRWLACGPMVIAGVLTIIAAFVPKGIPTVSLATMARFAINMSFNASIQWGTELLPTGVRASGSSFVHICGYISTLLSPFVVYSETYWSILPLLILGCVAVVGGLVGLLLPETRGRSMPQTIADGERLMRTHRLFGTNKKYETTNTEDIEETKVMKLIT